MAETVEILKELKEEMRPYQGLFSKATESILDQEVTSFPIFVIHKSTVEIGIPISNRDDISGDWSVNVSSLEEFSAKQLIKADKIENFKQVYKDPTLNFCLFVLTEDGATFVFLPRN